MPAGKQSIISPGQGVCWRVISWGWGAGWWNQGKDGYDGTQRFGSKVSYVMRNMWSTGHGVWIADGARGKGSNARMVAL